MATQSQIRQLQTPDHSVDVYPLTLEGAVFDEDGTQLSAKMSAMDASILAADGRVDSTQADIATLERSAESSRAYSAGEYLVYGNQLYRTTAAIPAGGTIAPGTNVTPTSVMEEIEGSGVTGVKGNAEASYRQGNVNLAYADMGTNAVANGGTGKTSHTANALLAGNGTDAVKNVATANGALYATAANGAAQFGTLPIAQGGTGKTTAADARTNLGLGGAATQAVANNLTTTAAGSVLDARQGKALNDAKLSTTGASTNTTVAFTSNDLAANTTVKTNTTTNQPSTVAQMATGEKLSSLFNKLSSMFASIRKLWNTVGTTAIDSSLGTTLTAAVNALGGITSPFKTLVYSESTATNTSGNNWSGEATKTLAQNISSYKYLLFVVGTVNNVSDSALSGIIETALVDCSWFRVSGRIVQPGSSGSTYYANEWYIRYVSNTQVVTMFRNTGQTVKVALRIYGIK